MSILKKPIITEKATAMTEKPSKGGETKYGFVVAKDADKNEIKFKEGMASSFELREAQLQLFAAQQEYLSALVSVVTSHTDLANFLNESL